MNLFFEIIEFARKRKKVWLLPIIFLCVVIGGLFLMTQGTVIAPFIYTIF